MKLATLFLLAAAAQDLVVLLVEFRFKGFWV